MQGETGLEHFLLWFQTNNLRISCIRIGSDKLWVQKLVRPVLKAMKLDSCFCINELAEFPPISTFITEDEGSHRLIRAPRLELQRNKKHRRTNQAKIDIGYWISPSSPDCMYNFSCHIWSI